MANAAAKSIHAAALAGENTTLAWMEQDDEPQAQGEQPDPVKALQLQIAELKGQIGQMNATPKPAVGIAGFAPRPQVQTEIDYSKLPDPAEDGAGYARALAEQTVLVTGNKQIVANWANEQQNATKKASDKLFNDFKKAYPEYANSRKAVETFAEECAEEAAAGRVDVAQYMFGTPDKFFKDVVGKMDEAGFAPKPKKGADAAADEEEDDNRAVGLPDGGTGGDGGKGKGKGKAPEKGSMMGSLQEWQVKSGFHP